MITFLGTPKFRIILKIGLDPQKFLKQIIGHNVEPWLEWGDSLCLVNSGDVQGAQGISR